MKMKLQNYFSTQLFFFTSLLFVFLLTSCGGSGIDDDNIAPPTSTGIPAPQVNVIILDYAELFLDFGTTYSFNNYDPNSDDYYISNDTLFTDGLNAANLATIHLTINDATYIDAKQWSDVHVLNPITVDDITIEINSFTDITDTIKVAANNFFFDNNESDGDTIYVEAMNTQNIRFLNNHLSTTKAYGATNQLELELNGASGEFLGFDLDAKIVHALSRNIADIEVSASDSLYATIKSVGDIYYKGNPEIILDDIGIGSLIDAN